MATFTDDFNRADADVGSNWTARQGAFQVLSNAVKANAANSYTEVAAATADFTDDHFAEITVTAKGNQDYIGPAVRVSASGCYAIKTDGRDIANNRIIKMTTTTLATLGSVNITCNVSDVLKLTVVGTTVTAYVNDVEIDQVTDSSFSTGQPGLWYDRSNTNATRGDDYNAEDISSGASISSVTPDSFDDGHTGIVIAGSGFGASQGSSSVTIGAATQTITAWGDTSITFTAVRSSESMGANTLTVTVV